MRWAALCVLLAPAAASALELSLQGGPVTLAAGDGAPSDFGGVARIGVAGGKRANERAELALETARVPSATSALGVPVTRSWSAISVRYMRFLDSQTPARLLWTAGLDLGLAGVRASDDQSSEGFFLGGHLGLGARVPLVTDRLDFQALVLARLGGVAPGIATTVGLVVNLD